MSRVIVVGSINVDLCCYLAKWPKVHETVHTTGFAQFLGGKGANQAVAAARLGADVSFVGAIGLKAYADFVRDNLNKEALDQHLIPLEDEPTGMAFIDIGPKSENIIRLVGGANAALMPEHILKKAVVFEGCGVLLLQNEVPVAVSVAAAQLARAHGATVVMDPAPSPAAPWTSDITQHFDIVTPNAVEAALYCGFVPETAEEGKRAARLTSEAFGCDVVVTMGADGVAWSHQGATGWMPVPKTDPVDTVGAGDCFNGAFARALTDDAPWEASLTYATHAASVSTTRKGAMVSLPTAEDVGVI